MLNNYSKNCVRLTTSSPASPKQEAPKRGRSGAGAGRCRVRYDHIAPLTRVAWCGEWRGLCVRRTTYLIARLSQEAPKRGRSEERGRRGCVVYAVRPHRPPPKSGMVWRVARLVVSTCVCGRVWGACRTRLALHRAEQKETTDSLFPLFY